MSSTNTYTEQKYCVYITNYLGDALPPKNNSTITPSNYIGSTSVDKINNGYKGSVSSKKYKTIWESELKNNPHLFSVEIISYHDTRTEATNKELQLQKIFNAVTNPLFVNMAYAQPEGFFGIVVTGKDNPNYNKKRSTEQKQNHSELMKSKMEDKNSIYHSTDYKNKMSLTKKGIPCLQSTKIKLSKKYQLTNPEGISFCIIGLKQFCKDNNLTLQGMCAVSKGKQTHHKKWKCVQLF
jgi:hypothetical protein